jgi:hypothetical protein
VSRGRGVAVIAFAAALLVTYVLWERVLSPEARVRRTLDSAAIAAERADIDGLLSYVSSGYQDFLHPDRSGFEVTAREGFDRVDRLNVTLDPVETEVNGSDARVVLDAVVVAIRGEERYVVLGTPFEPERLTVRLKREAGGWRIARVEVGSK